MPPLACTLYTLLAFTTLSTGLGIATLVLAIVFQYIGFTSSSISLGTCTQSYLLSKYSHISIQLMTSFVGICLGVLMDILSLILTVIAVVSLRRIKNSGNENPQLGQQTLSDDIFTRSKYQLLYLFLLIGTLGNVVCFGYFLSFYLNFQSNQTLCLFAYDTTNLFIIMIISGVWILSFLAVQIILLKLKLHYSEDENKEATKNKYLQMVNVTQQPQQISNQFRESNNQGPFNQRSNAKQIQYQLEQQKQRNQNANYNRQDNNGQLNDYSKNQRNPRERIPRTSTNSPSRMRVMMNQNQSKNVNNPKQSEMIINLPGQKRQYRFNDNTANKNDSLLNSRNENNQLKNSRPSSSMIVKNRFGDEVKNSIFLSNQKDSEGVGKQFPREPNAKETFKQYRQRQIQQGIRGERLQGEQKLPYKSKAEEGLMFSNIKNQSPNSFGQNIGSQSNKIKHQQKYYNPRGNSRQSNYIQSQEQNLQRGLSTNKISRFEKNDNKFNQTPFNTLNNQAKQSRNGEQKGVYIPEGYKRALQNNLSKPTSNELEQNKNSKYRNDEHQDSNGQLVFLKKGREEKNDRRVSQGQGQKQFSSGEVSFKSPSRFDSKLDNKFVEEEQKIYKNNPTSILPHKGVNERSPQSRKRLELVGYESGYNQSSMGNSRNQQSPEQSRSKAKTRQGVLTNYIRGKFA